MISVYKLTNRVNGKIYIGQHAGSLEKYWGSGKLIKYAIRKYGKRNFDKVVLRECAAKTEADAVERQLILAHNSTDLTVGYNLCANAFGGDTLSNHPNREEIGRKISRANTGRKHSAVSIELMKESQSSHHWRTGVRATPEQTNKLKTFSGRRHKESSIEKIKLANRTTGKCHKLKPRGNWPEKTAEHKAKLRLALLGRKPKNAKIVVVGASTFTGMRDAAAFLKIPYGTLRRQITSRNVAFNHIFLRDKPKVFVRGRVYLCGDFIPKFKLGDLVKKIRGSCWSGKVVGTYSTELTPEGYCVESSTEKGSVQIYPASALELAPPA
jgi:dihydrofolate reductase (trimethoprim resistance protein)